MTELLIQLLSPDDVDGLNDAYAIYYAAILQSEQRTEAAFKALIARTDYRLVVARRGQAIVGVAVSWVPPNDDLWLLEYAAVAPVERGSGIGAQLVTASRLLAGMSRTGLIEVDANHGAPEQARRLAFYSRLSCRRLAGLDYILPLDAFGTPPPMWLLALAPDATTSLDVETVERWLRRIYADVYGQHLSDPRLARMIDQLPDQIALAPI